MKFIKDLVYEIYVTKYALSDGILCRKARYTGLAEMMMDVENKQSYHGKGKDWHETFEDAKIKAEQMRERKIASLKKSILKLEKMEFKI